MPSNPIESWISETLREICNSLGIENPSITLEIPRIREHGELSSNVAMTSAKQTGMQPRRLADKLASLFPTSNAAIQEVGIAGPGFLNFKLSPIYFYSLLSEIIASPEIFGSVQDEEKERWLFEFVSANPTGPLNVVNARAASVGDTLVKVFRKRGIEVQSEYYVNDGGGQVRKLGESVKARIDQLLKGLTESNIPDGGYHGLYLVDIARQILTERDNRAVVKLHLDDHALLGRYAAKIIRESQEESLQKFNVSFNRWFFESELYDTDKVEEAFKAFNDKNLIYVKDGASFFKASEYGDSEDRVLKTSQANFTYIVPDIAYHLDKRARGYDRAVVLLGPDHHGHTINLKAGLKALNLPDNFYIPILVQQVNLKRDGEEIKMSKRAGVGITMDEVIEEVGVDAARFFFLMRKITSHLDFDMNLAKRHSDDNPVYYVQYAHARICSILRQPGVENYEENVDFTCLLEEEELDLLRMLARFPWTLSIIVRNIEPHPLTIYLMELARSFHLFYTKHRVIGDDRRLTGARLMLCKGTKSVLAEGLKLMGVSAPEKM